MAGLSRVDVRLHGSGGSELRTVDEVKSPERLTRAQDNGARAVLDRLIEDEIIPRLLLAHAATPLPVSLVRPLSVPLGAAEVAELTRLATRRDMDGASAVQEFVAGLRTRGASLDRIFLDLLAPAARHLGWLWEEDRADFMEVTLGLCRLQQLLRNLGPEFEGEKAVEGPERRALLVPLPGEQHTFGISMVAEFFRRAGYDVRGGVTMNMDEILRLVRTESFTVVGLSISCEGLLEPLAAAIRQIRSASKNPIVGILVGGPVFAEHTERVSLVGADATAIDGHHAVVQTDVLLGLMARRC